MRKLFNILILGAVILSSSSCKKFLDVNENPNNPTNSTPNIVLPAAIVQVASAMTSYDNFGAWTGGYKANAGGYGGWGTVWTYNFTSNDYSAMWTNSFGAINQLNFVINNTTADGPLKYYNAEARIMKAFIYTKLVDQYGDVPYTEAGQGLNKLNPKYDKYSDVYKACYAELNAALAILNSAVVTNVTIPVTAGQDPFGGGGAGNGTAATHAAGILRWKQFVQTLKLKMLIRAQKVSELSSWVAASKASLATTAAEYLQDDAIVQPGYSSSIAAQFNPQWSVYGWNSAGTSTTTGLSNLPTKWAVSFYNGAQYTDNTRGALMFKSYGASITQSIAGSNFVIPSGPAANQLGYDAEPVPRSISGSYWYIGSGSGTTANSATNVGGVLKGATMPQVLMTLAEVKFLLAEATLPSVNLFTGSTQTLYEQGIDASYAYLYKGANYTYGVPNYTASQTATTITATRNAYIAANPNATVYDLTVPTRIVKAVVDLSKATNDNEKLAAIITQKYLAVQMITSEEGFNEYRRTGFPGIIYGSTNPAQTFASLKSASPAADKLPTRVSYPAVEFQVNTENVPKGISPVSTKIFYAK